MKIFKINNEINLKKKYLQITRVHSVKGSPVCEFLHEHMGLWFITLQLALTPQGFGQGFTHLLFMHALSRGHSELTIHSGRQFGGVPS